MFSLIYVTVPPTEPDVPPRVEPYLFFNGLPIGAAQKVGIVHEAGLSIPSLELKVLMYLNPDIRTMTEEEFGEMMLAFGDDPDRKRAIALLDKALVRHGFKKE